MGFCQGTYTPIFVRRDRVMQAWGQMNLISGVWSREFGNLYDVRERLDSFHLLADL